MTQKPVIGADGKAVTETVEVLRPAFKVVSVFDVSQTDGKELPDIIVDELKGTVENYEAFFDALRQESPVPISFEDIPGGAKGFFSPVERDVYKRQILPPSAVRQSVCCRISRPAMRDCSS